MNLGRHLRALPVQTVDTLPEQMPDSIESQTALSVPCEPARVPPHEFATQCMEAHPVSPTDDFLMSDERLAAASTVGKETDRRILGVQEHSERKTEEKDEDEDENEEDEDEDEGEDKSEDVNEDGDKDEEKDEDNQDHVG